MVCKSFFCDWFLTISRIFFIAEAPVSTSLPPLGAMFAPADGYLFISFINVPGAWPYSAAMVIGEAPVVTLIPTLGHVALCDDGLFPLPPHPAGFFVMFAPADDSLFILFRNVPDVWLFSAATVLSEAPVWTSLKLGVYWLFVLAQPPWCMSVMFTPSEDYLFILLSTNEKILTLKKRSNTQCITTL